METCIVCCKLPHGLTIDDFVEKEGAEKTRLKLNGANSLKVYGGPNGYGMTVGVPLDAFEEWLKTHQWLAYVKNKSIFIQKDERSASSEARARMSAKLEHRTGFEPVDPTDPKDPRNRGVVLDDKGRKAYEAQKSLNPDRNRQQIEA